MSRRREHGARGRVAPARSVPTRVARRLRARSIAAALPRPATIFLMFATLLVATLVVLVLLAAPAPDRAAAAGAATEPMAATGPAPVWVTRVKGIIDPALSGYLVETMERAADAQAAALIVQIDTPGGLDTSMRDIIQAEVDSPIPIVFYVYPQGARAASAGLYILMGADVAAMAPQTNLGAATPVSLSGEMDEVMKAKVTNDAAAYISGLATTHGRNAVWAERAVRESVSLPADEALQQNVIEFVAADLPALLQAIDGYVSTPKGLTLQTAGAPLVEVKMGWIQRLLHVISSPDIAYILLSLGVMGIILEFSSPGLGASGIAGVIALLFAFYSFQVLPVSLVGIALVVLAMILYVAELLVASGGVLGIGGTAALIAGGLLLFDSPAPFLRVSWPALVIVGVVALVLSIFVIRAVTKARHRRPTTGIEGLLGTTGVTLSPLTPFGQVKLHGETWRARAEKGDLLKDQPIEVLGTEGLTLVVRPSGSDVDSQEEQGQNT